MKSLAKSLLVGAALGAAVAISAPAEAQVGIGLHIGNVSIGVGGPVYYGYDYWRSCDWYFAHDYPAPYRCYDYYRGRYPHLYVEGGFVFRDRDSWDHWRNRDDFRHWRHHDWDRDHREWERHHGHDHDRHDRDHHDHDHHGH